MKNLSYPLAIVLASLVIGGSFFLVQFQKQALLEKEKKQEAAVDTAQGIALTACLYKAGQDFNLVWNDSCKYRGTNVEKDAHGKIISCWLPTYLANGFEKTMNEAKDICLKQYK
jgi:hypothetical protein